MLDLAREIRRPAEDPGWLVKLLVGTALSLTVIKWYLFPLSFFAAGYLYNLFVNHFKQEETGKLPEWEDWKRLFLNGLILLLICTGYLILPEFCYMVSSSILEGGFLAKIVGLVFMAGTALLTLAAFFFIPMAVAQYNRNEKISSAFRIREIWDRIFNVGDDYFKITLLAVIVLIVLAVIRIIPWIGSILASLSGFYAGLVFAPLFGQVSREAYACDLDAEQTT